MPLKAMAIALLVPPMSLLFVIIAGLLIERRHRRTGRCLAWFGIFGLLVLAMPVVGGSLLVALEQDLPLTPPADQPPRAIVVLGGDVQRSRSQNPLLLLGPLSLERVRAGALLARRTGLPLLVTGGSLDTGEPPVAELMAASLAQEFNVPAKWIEAESRDTWENAQLSAAILREQGVQSVYVVTHAWHMHRAVLAFNRAGLAVTAAPTRLDRLPAPIARDFVPDVGGWRASYFAFHEWIGTLWYAVR